MLKSKVRADLRALASTQETVAQIGKDGLGENMLAGLDAALEAREIIKVGVLKNSAEAAEEVAQSLAAATRSEVVTVIGSKIVLYRRSHKKGILHVVAAAPSKKKDAGEDVEKEEKKPSKKPNSSKKTNFKGEHFVEENAARARRRKENAAAQNDSPSGPSIFGNKK